MYVYFHHLTLHSSLKCDNVYCRMCLHQRHIKLYSILHITTHDMYTDFVLAPWSDLLSCGWLDVPYSIKREPITYLVGYEVEITGCISGYRLEGPTVYRCISSTDGIATWSPDVTTKCYGNCPIILDVTKFTFRYTYCHVTIYSVLIIAVG